MRQIRLLASLSLACLLAACGGGGTSNLGTVSTSTARGTLTQNPPPRITSLTATDFAASLRATSTGQGLLAVAGTPVCGIDVQYIQYATVGGSGETTTASGALMVPTGTSASCSGARPVMLYAHGTTTDKSFNLANFTDSNNSAYGEAVLVAAMYAAQGFIVVAPNYAGYDSSTLPYHPYLNGDQQSKDMIDALTAARAALPRLLAPVTDSGKLFVSGYSQGGYVAMATHRAMQAAGISVTASAPLSAPSAISLLVDYSFLGWPALGGTIFTPMLTTSWQRQFGNVYASVNDVFETQYAATIDNLLPSATPINTLFATGKLPTQALYPANAVPGPVSPALSAFYGANNLIKGSYLTATAGDVLANACAGNALPASAASLGSATPLGCTPTNGFRKAAQANDLRNWTPARPMLMCGGANDPTVNFTSTLATSGYFRAKGVPAAALTVVDVDSAITGTADPFAAAKVGFAQLKASTAAASVAGGATDGGATAVTLAYHGSLVPPFCNAVARSFFQQVLAAGL